eukprot:3766324-Prymnesium_polylepis.2
MDSCWCIISAGGIRHRLRRTVGGREVDANVNEEHKVHERIQYCHKIGNRLVGRCEAEHVRKCDGGVEHEDEREQVPDEAESSKRQNHLTQVLCGKVVEHER